MLRFLGAAGRVLVTGGLLLLLFVAHQLWGTGFYETREQNRLERQFEQTLREARPGTTTTPTPESPTSTAAPPTAAVPVVVPRRGEALAFIEIPKIGVSKVVVEGVGVADLRKGPGHYPGTPLPGQEGNTAIAGHRTTYGAPFADVNELEAGDEITLRTVHGTFTYEVNRAPFVVDPGDGHVLLSEADPSRPGRERPTLTLTTCHPKYSAAQRLIVTASLRLPPGEAPLPPTEPSPSTPTTISGLSGERASRAPALLWGIVAGVLGLAWWFFFHRYPRWTTWIAGAVPFGVALFVFYTYLERVLPSNY